MFFRSLKAQDKPDWSQDPLYKTALCNKWEEAEGSCEYGDSCRFAHGMRTIASNLFFPMKHFF